MKFYITIKNRIAEVLSDGGQLPRVVCDNTEGSITFLFDHEWKEQPEKTARFIYREDMGKGSLVYVDVAFTGDTVGIPLLHNVSEVFVGVIAGDLMTTSAARFSCIPSVYGFSADPVGTEGTETKSVSLDLSVGDQVVAASLGKTMTSVIIEKPATLIPENIRSGIVIAGVLGTFGKGIDAPEVYRAGYGVQIYTVDGADLYDCHVVTPDGTDTLVAVLQIEGATDYLDCEAFFKEGDNVVYVVARNSSTGVVSPESEHIVITFEASEYYLNAPEVRVDGSILTVTDKGGNVTPSSYKVYIREGTTELGMVMIFEGTTLDLDEIGNLESGKTYTFTVAAYDVYTETESPESAAVSYTRAATDSGEGDGEEDEVTTLAAPTVSINGTKLTIYAVDGANVYEVHRITTADTVIRTLSINGSTWIDIEGNLEEGENKIYVVARSTVTGQSSERSAILRVYYDGADADVLTAPTITLSGDMLTVTPGQGSTPTSYDLYVGGEMGYTTTSTTIDLKKALADYDSGTYTLHVRAAIEATGLLSEVSNTVTYVHTATTETYVLTLRDYSDSGRNVLYVLNDPFYDSSIADGSYYGPIILTDTGCVLSSNLKASDEVYLVITDTEYVDASMHADEGCTVTFLMKNSNGDWFKISSFTGDASVTVSFEGDEGN